MSVIVASWLGCTGPETPPEPDPSPESSVDGHSAALLPTGTHTGSPDHSAAPGAPSNVLLVILDDVGVDKLSAYGAFPGQPATPTFDRLVAEGVRFTNAYAAPTCSPSRAALFTGRFGRRTGMGRWLDSDLETWSLPTSEITLPTVLAAAPVPYASALLGKWHLVSYDHFGAERHPTEAGFPVFTGTLGNLGTPYVGGHGSNYFQWEKVVGGEVVTSTTYATTDLVDDAVEQLRTLPEPFFLTVSTHAAHVPNHAPPAALLDAPVPADATVAEQHLAMVVALDRELGRLFDAFSPELRARTTVVVFSDNGSDKDFMVPPYDTTRKKGTVFDGGVRVPFVVTGPTVTAPGSVTDALISVVDVLPTLAELGSVDLAAAAPVALDGVSFLSVLGAPAAPGPRRFVYAEEFEPNGPPPYPARTDVRMVRDATHKLMRDGAGTEALFRYAPGALDEGPDLLRAGPLSVDDQQALDTLRAELDRMTATLVYEGPF